MGFATADLSTVPLPKKYRRMAREKFLKILRFRRYLSEANLRARFFCRDCGAEVALKAGELDIMPAPGAVNPKTDKYSLACRCTVWTVGK